MQMSCLGGLCLGRIVQGGWLDGPVGNPTPGPVHFFTGELEARSPRFVLGIRTFFHGCVVVLESEQRAKSWVSPTMPTGRCSRI